MTLFDQAFAYLIQDEGTTYTNNPGDSGGPTKFGVTKKAYAAFLHIDVTDDVIAGLTITEAKQFYAETFWKPLLCDQISKPALAIAVFDTAVLHGAMTTAMRVQRALNLVSPNSLEVDGHIGTQTLAALSAVSEASFLWAFGWILINRIDLVIQTHPDYEVFRRGWETRTSRLLTLLDPAVLTKLSS